MPDDCGHACMQTTAIRSTAIQTVNTGQIALQLLDILRPCQHRSLCSGLTLPTESEYVMSNAAAMYACRQHLA